jgi:hypothetical protein
MNQPIKEYDYGSVNCNQPSNQKLYGLGLLGWLTIGLPAHCVHWFRSLSSDSSSRSTDVILLLQGY